MAERDEERMPGEASEDRHDHPADAMASRRGFLRWSAGMVAGSALLLGVTACGGDEEGDEDGEAGDEEESDEGD